MMTVVDFGHVRFTPIPDSVLGKNSQLGDTATALDLREQRFGGLTTPFPGDMTPGFNTPASKSPYFDHIFIHALFSLRPHFLSCSIFTDALLSLWLHFQLNCVLRYSI